MWRTVLSHRVCCVLLVVATSAVLAERVTHRRFLQDLLENSGNKAEKMERITPQTAEQYLQTFGYMPEYKQQENKWEYVNWEGIKKQMARSRDGGPSQVPIEFADRPSKTANLNDVLEFDDSFEKSAGREFALPHERSLFEEALKELQKRSNLPVTGELDDRTISLMYQPRCGVPDNEELVVLDQGHSSEEEPVYDDPDVEVTAAVDDIDNTTSADEGSVAPSASSPSTTTDGSENNSTTTKSGSVTATKETTPGRSTMTSTSTKDYAKSSTNSLPDGPNIDKKGLRRKRFIERFHNGKSRQTRSTGEGSSSTTTQDDDTLVRYPRDKEVIYYRILSDGYTRDMSANEQRGAIFTAFRIWDEILPINFVERREGDIMSVDTEVAFETRFTTCKAKFTPTARVLSHAWVTGPIHFNDYRQFAPTRTSYFRDNYGPYDLLSVAIHEVGHALGLTHVIDRPSIMQNTYRHPQDEGDVELDWLDRKLAQAIYGECEVEFDTVFDWVRPSDDDDNNIYNSYFFKDDFYWMYENQHNRTRYGDPKFVGQEWFGIPTNKLDAIVHVWSPLHNRLFFFKGDKYWMYDSTNDMAFEYDEAGNYIKNGREIELGFPALPGTNYPSIPSNIDAAYFDKRDDHIYFFKGSQVYAFDTMRWGCCKTNFGPARIGRTFLGLPSNIDAAYRSHYYQKVFFFKGKYYYEGQWNPRRESTTPITTSQVVYKGLIRQRWYDICEVGEINLQ